MMIYTNRLEGNSTTGGCFADARNDNPRNDTWSLLLRQLADRNDVTFLTIPVIPLPLKLIPLRLLLVTILSPCLISLSLTR